MNHLNIKPILLFCFVLFLVNQLLFLGVNLYCITTCIFHIYKSFKDEKIYRNINIGSAIAFGILSVIMVVFTLIVFIVTKNL